MNAATKWDIFVGTNDGQTHKPLPAARVEKVINRVVTVFSEVFGGCTLTGAQGAWQGERENTIIITVITDQPNLQAWQEIQSAALFIKAKLNQNEVLVTKAPVETFSIS